MVDCTQLQYQLGAKSDTLQIGAGEVKFLSSSEYRRELGHCDKYALLTIHDRYLPRCHILRHSYGTHLGADPRGSGYSLEPLHLKVITTTSWGPSLLWIEARDCWPKKCEAE